MRSRCPSADPGLRKRIGTAVEDSRLTIGCKAGRACSGDRKGELGLERGRGGSSSGKASNCQGCKPVRRVNSARLSSNDSSGGVLGRSMPPGAAKKECLASSVGRGNSGRSPGMVLLVLWVRSSDSLAGSGAGVVASATARSSKKD